MSASSVSLNMLAKISSTLMPSEQTEHGFSMGVGQHDISIINAS